MLVNKENIERMFFQDNMNGAQIAQSLNVSRQYVARILKNIDGYAEEKERRKEINKSKPSANKSLETKLKNMFFNDNMNGAQIAQSLNVSRQYVTRILKNIDGYAEEKERRKEINIEINKDKTKKYISLKREENKIVNQENKSNEEALMAGLLRQQEINAKSMSRTRKITDKQIVIDNLQHYKYDKSKSHLIFQERSGVIPADIPKKINIHEF